MPITYSDKNKDGTGNVTLWRDVDANEVKSVVNTIENDLDSAEIAISNLETKENYSANAIAFDTTPTVIAPSEGLLQWSASDGTLQLGMQGGLVTMQIGQEMFIKVINKTGVIISNGSAVYLSGRQGAVPKISLARADVEATSTCIGLVTEDIAIDAEGYVTTFGYIRGIKTNYLGWAEGDPLYLSTVTAGELTNVQPALPNFSSIVATVGIVHNTLGSILVNVISQRNMSNYALLAPPEDLLFTMQPGTAIAVTQPTYRDEYPAMTIPAGGAAAPDAVPHTIGGVLRTLYGFDGAATQEILSGSFEIPHDYMIGEAIEAHVHWRPSASSTGTVKWYLDWEYSPPNAAPIPQASLSVIATLASDKQYWHLLNTFGNLPQPGTPFAIGGKIGFNLRRTPADDTFGADALLEQISLHVPCDTAGSRQIYVK